MGKKDVILEEAPVFHPTEAEFQNALHYIASIRAQAEPYGICRIVPPDSWRPPFALPDEWKFPTKVQKVHHLQERQGGFDPHTWRMEYERFLQKTGRVVQRWPLYAGEELDLCKLYNAVKRHGYLEGVTVDRKWPAIARLMRKDGGVEQSPNAGAILRQLYQKYLLAYETYERDPAHPAHFGEGSSSGEEEKPKEIKQSPSKKAKSSHNEKLEASEMDLAAAFLELGGYKGVRKRDGLAAAREAEMRQEQKCQACEGPGHEDKMILCDRCDSGWHIHCLSPPLLKVPLGNWYCPRCVTCEDAFGFEEGTEYTLEEFQRHASRFKRKWFGSDARLKARSPGEIESEFWRIVEQSKEPVEVLYGSDLDASTYGSGFPRLGHPRGKVEEKQWEEYAKSSWNLNNMPRDDASVLNRIDDQIPGVMVPWLYIGMMFSSFCWHYEDHCLYSINYCHWGEPKKWYGVPGSCAAEFEEVMKRSFPDMFTAQPDLLFQLVTMLNPAVLRKHGVPVYTTLQGPREFVITFPRSYHGGFNMGFNCAEAVNFAPSDWLPWGGFGVERYRQYHRKAIVSHDQLLCVVAKGLLPASASATLGATAAETHRWLSAELSRVLAHERSQREALWLEGTTASMRIPKHTKDDRIGEEEDPECLICKYYLHLSAVVCTCRPGKMACLKHVGELCECQQASERSLLYRYSLAELEDLLPMPPPPASPSGLERPETPPLEDVRPASAADDGPTSASFRRSDMMQQTSVPATEAALAVAVVKQEVARKKVNGGLFSHTELAVSWAAKASKLLEERPSLDQVATLLQEADEFLWGGHEVDSVRAVVSQCVALQEWAAELAIVTSSGGRKVPLSRLQEAGRQLSSGSLQVAGHVHLVRILEERLRKAAAMAHKMEVAMAATGEKALDLRQAQALLHEAESLPVVLPACAGLRRLVAQAQAWADELNRIVGGGPVSRRRAAGELLDLEYLSSLLKQGHKQPLRTPEVAHLETTVARVQEWQAKARLLLDFTGPLKVLQSCLREAEALAAHVPEMDVLAGRVLTAEDWQRRACKGLVFEGAKQQDENVAPSDRSTQLRLMRGLLTEGDRLNLDMPELASLRIEIERQEWLEGACYALIHLTHPEKLQHLVHEGNRMNVGGSVLSRLAALSSLAADWEKQAAAVLSKRGGIEELAALLRMAQDIPAILPALQAVNPAYEAAKAWGERAHPFLRSKQSRRHTRGQAGPLPKMAELEALVEEVDSLAVTVKEADVLAVRLAEVNAWRTKAASVLQEGGPGEEAIVEVLVADGEAMGLDLGPIMEQLQAKLAAKRWERTAKQVASGRRALAEVAALVKEARGLIVDSALLEQLQGAVSAGEEWEASVKRMLGGKASEKSSVGQLEALEQAGRSLPVLLPETYRQLEQTLQHHRHWQQAVQNCVGVDQDGLVARQELERLLAEGEASVVADPALDSLRDSVVQATEWEGQLRRALAKKGTSADVNVCSLLTKVVASLQAALASLRGEEGAPRLFCACQAVFQEAGSMIACDACDEWYHLRCVGLTQAAVAQIKKYTCPFCTALQTGALPLEVEASHKHRSTRQPPFAVIEDLYFAGTDLPSDLQSCGDLEDVINLANEYKRLAQGLLETARTADPLLTPLKRTPLLPLLKSVTVCEVELPGLLSAVLAGMAGLSWRHRAAKLLSAPHKPTPRTVTRLLKEAPPSVAEDGDALLLRLQDLDSAASAWLEQAREVANDGGAAPVSEVTALMERGRNLGVLLDKELEELQERCTLYCTCQKPYDEDKAMIACDRCERWFHYGCVGLEEPKALSGKAGKEVEVELDFLCEACVTQVARKRAERAEKQRQKQERQAERARQQREEDSMEEQGPIDLDEESEREEEEVEVFALPAIPLGLKRKRSFTTRRVKEIMDMNVDIKSSGSDFEDIESGDERAGGRPARKRAGFNQKYANEQFVLL